MSCLPQTAKELYQSSLWIFFDLAIGLVIIILTHITFALMNWEKVRLNVDLKLYSWIFFYIESIVVICASMGLLVVLWLAIIWHRNRRFAIQEVAKTMVPVLNVGAAMALAFSIMSFIGYPIIDYKGRDEKGTTQMDYVLDVCAATAHAMIAVAARIISQRVQFFAGPNDDDYVVSETRAKEDILPFLDAFLCIFFLIGINTGMAVKYGIIAFSNDPYNNEIKHAKIIFGHEVSFSICGVLTVPIMIWLIYKWSTLQEEQLKTNTAVKNTLRFLQILYGIVALFAIALYASDYDDNLYVVNICIALVSLKLVISCGKLYERGNF